MKIFPKPNRDSDSVKNSESHDIKVLTWFPGNLVLEIFIKICNCVGSTNMRGWFFTKCLIAIYNCPVILRCLLVQVFGVKPFFSSPPNLCHIAQKMQRNRIIYSMFLHLVELFGEVQKTISNTISFKNIQKYSQKIGTISKFYHLFQAIIWYF